MLRSLMLPARVAAQRMLAPAPGIRSQPGSQPDTLLPRVHNSPQLQARGIAHACAATGAADALRSARHAARPCLQLAHHMCTVQTSKRVQATDAPVIGKTKALIAGVQGVQSLAQGVPPQTSSHAALAFALAQGFDSRNEPALGTESGSFA